MLFDIRGHRRTVVRWVYGGLAAVFMVGFVGFGVGSDVGGGLLGGHGGGAARGHGNGRSLDDQAEELRDRVREQPGDRRAWRRLSLVLASVAYEQGGGHGGGARLAEDGMRRLAESVVAYEEYARLLGERRPARAVAQTAARSYMTMRRPFDAVEAQRAASPRREAQAQFLLAQYAAAAGDTALVEGAMRRALAAAPREQRRSLRAQADALVRSSLVPAGASPGGAHGG